MKYNEETYPNSGGGPFKDMDEEDVCEACDIGDDKS